MITNDSLIVDVKSVAHAQKEMSKPQCLYYDFLTAWKTAYEAKNKTLYQKTGFCVIFFRIRMHICICVMCIFIYIRMFFIHVCVLNS